MKIIIIPDPEKANSLKISAKISLRRLNLTQKEEFPSNTLTDYYDILHKLMESYSLKKGIKFKGKGAHYELINFICNEKRLKENQRVLLQKMRELRNEISYEGRLIPSSFISDNEKTIKEIIQSFP